MRRPDLYRCFLGFRPDPIVRCCLASLADAAGQAAKRTKDEHLHLTLCVVAETIYRDRSIVSRVASALEGRTLSTCPFQLDTMQGGERGAFLRAVKRQNELQDFYGLLLTYLSAQGIVPLHRQWGLHPHVTLGRDPCARLPLMLPCEWVPDELLLIESEVGCGIHHVLARWPLLPPRQGGFLFEDTTRAALTAQEKVVTFA